MKRSSYKHMQEFSPLTFIYDRAMCVYACVYLKLDIRFMHTTKASHNTPITSCGNRRITCILSLDLLCLLLFSACRFTCYFSIFLNHFSAMSIRIVSKRRTLTQQLTLNSNVRTVFLVQLICFTPRSNVERFL